MPRAGLSPLGIPEDGLAFDINPYRGGRRQNGTHFEQLYQRAKAASEQCGGRVR
jgi:hypothetical protein